MADKFVALVKEVHKYHAFQSAIICNGQKEIENFHLRTEISWKVKNYSAYENQTCVSQSLYNLESKKVIQLPPTIQDKRIVLTAHSPCGRKVAHLFQNAECCFINVIKNGETISINIKEMDVVGKVYIDPNFSCFVWDSSSKFLAFVAEKKLPKATSHFEHGEKDSKGRGEKFAYRNDWGEQMEGQSTSVIVVLDPDIEDIRILTPPEGVCVGELVWTVGLSLVGVAIVTEPFRLGLIYCKNRESFLFEINFEGQFKEITERGLYHVQQPRFSDDGSKLVFLRSPKGGPHIQSAQLVLMLWDSKALEVLVDEVFEEQRHEDFIFRGLCGRTRLPARCWTAGDRGILFSTPEDNVHRSFLLDTENKSLISFSKWWRSCSVVDVLDDYAIVSVSSCIQPDIPLLVDLRRLKSSLNEVGGEVQMTENEGFFNLNPSCSAHFPAKDFAWESFSCLSAGTTVHGFFVSPKIDQGVKSPVIVWIHGGPHSMSVMTFMPSLLFFCRLGYNVVFPNYRGSIGFGNKYLSSLAGNCGSMDVEDVHNLTLEFLKKRSDDVDKSRIALFGGSHGGFLAAHLSAKFPGFYKVVAVRNPVIDVSSMTATTDIPDWNFVESGHLYQPGDVGDVASRAKMLSMSPANFIENVIAPTLLLLGTNDKRVPMSQGLFYHKKLLANNVPSKVYVYEDNHALDKVEVLADCLVQTALWFEKYM